MTKPVMYLTGLLVLGDLYDELETKVETAIRQGKLFDEDDADARLHSIAESFVRTIEILWGSTDRMTLRLVEVRLLELADRATTAYRRRSLMNAWSVLVYHIYVI